MSGGEKTCPRCGNAFVCGMDAGERRCWCAELPVLREIPEPSQGCLCPGCLKEQLAKQDQAPG